MFSLKVEEAEVGDPDGAEDPKVVELLHDLPTLQPGFIVD